MATATMMMVRLRHVFLFYLIVIIVPDRSESFQFLQPITSTVPTSTTSTVALSKLKQLWTSSRCPSSFHSRPSRYNRYHHQYSLINLDATTNKDDFWNQQQSLIDEMKRDNENALKIEGKEKYEQLQRALLGDTVFFAAIIFSLLWLACDNPFVSFSYVFGATFGLAYTYGLSKYVATLGGSIEDAADIQGAGVGQARFAFLLLLFILVGKLRVYGLIEIPSIMGFFTYQIASLSQALRDASE
jgi:hypothetical protein